MHTLLHATRTAALIAGLLICAGLPARAAEEASAADTARILAGMQPAATSPLAALTKEPGWQQHARSFDADWKSLEGRQLSRIRAWSTATLTDRKPTMFYMFSGPDFLYADAFFPAARTYVLSGLEPVGRIPDLTKLRRGALAGSLAQIRSSLSSVLNYSFFITKNMKTQLRSGELTGTVPILYVFLARSGKTISDVSLVALDKDGVEQPMGTTAAPRGQSTGVKIAFAGSDGVKRTLYYFSTDLSDSGVANSGFLKFCEKLAPGDSFIKSASYLLHSGNFSKVREFLLANSAAVVQDDSGVPVRYFAPEQWQLHPFGNYIGPISIFSNQYQPKLREVFQRGRARPIDFGVGYRWRVRESNLLVAVKSKKAASSQ